MFINTYTEDYYFELKECFMRIKPDFNNLCPSDLNVGRLAFLGNVWGSVIGVMKFLSAAEKIQ